ncbi:MAG: guanylate kinase [Chloroflexi bacterium]|nr:guanylate kinase [Chloroflexota bacterium]
MTEPSSLPQPTALLVVISGPSGVGKDSVLRGLKERGLPFRFVPTMNTRPRRPDETNGVDYYFVTTEEFVTLMEQGELLEHAVVYGDYKGIPKKPIREALQSGQDVVLRVDVQGAATLKRLIPEAVFIFLSALNEEELVARLSNRQTESPESLRIRIATAREELKRMSEFDYVVVNHADRLEEAVQDVIGIIRAEHCRVHPRTVKL